MRAYRSMILQRREAHASSPPVVAAASHMAKQVSRAPPKYTMAKYLGRGDLASTSRMRLVASRA